MRFVVFGGVVRFTPGGITRVNTDALNQVQASENGVVALVGEADGGAPGSAGLIELRDPSKARELFKSGPLADAIPLAFQPSADPDVPGGASKVIVYKTNDSTQSSISIPAGDTAYTPIVSAAATSNGSGSTDVICNTLTGTVNDQYNGKWLVLRPYTATAEVRTITDYVASTTTFTVSPAFTLASASTNAFLVVEPTHELVAAVNTGSSSSTSVAVKSVTMTADEHIGRWLYIQNTSSEYFWRQITDNTTSAFTVSPALPATPTAGAWVAVLPNCIDLTSINYGTEANGIKVSSINAGTLNSKAKVVSLTANGETEISPEVGGVPFLKLTYTGGAVSATKQVSAATVDQYDIVASVGGMTPNAYDTHMVKVTDGSDIWYDQISSNDATTFYLVNGLPSVPSAGSSIQVLSVTGAVMKVSGSAGEATGLTATITGVTGDDLSVSFTQGMTLRDLATAIELQSPNYVATITAGVNQDVALCADFDYGQYTEVPIMTSAEMSPDGLYQNVVALVNYFNLKSELVTATRSTSGSYAGSVGPVTNVYGLGALQLSGGSRGTSSDSSFQAGFDALLLTRVNSVVALIDEDLANEGYGSTAHVDAVAQQLASHVAYARGAGESERGGFIGFSGTKAEIIAQANAINDGDVQLTCQNVDALNASGSLKTFGPRMLAVLAAGMRAGGFEVGTPLTHKYIRCSGVASTDSDWSPADKTDAADFVEAGVLFAEKAQGKGVRWVRDLTTYVKDSNLAWAEGNVRDEVRYFAYGLRTYLVDRFTGKKGTPITAAAVRDATVDFCELMRSNNVIVDSTDLATGQTIRAYHNVKVTISGDVATVKVGFFPAPGINFILNDLFVQLPTQSA